MSSTTTSRCGRSSMAWSASSCSVVPETRGTILRRTSRRLFSGWIRMSHATRGDPGRVFLWAQSAGNVPTGTYVGHPEFYGPKGVGLKGVIFMSPATFNILPATPPRTGPNPPCGPQPAAAPAPAQAPAAGAGRAGQPDAATQLARSNLQGLVNSKVPFLITTAELDPPSIIAFAETLKDQLDRKSTR